MTINETGRHFLFGTEGTSMFATSTSISTLTPITDNAAIMSQDAEQDPNLFGDKLTPFEWHFYVFNGIIGSILNFAVLLIGLFHTDTHDKPRQIIVINMTFADLATCLVYMLTRPYLNRFPLFMCYPYYIAIFSCQMCSCLNLLWLNVDKLIYIKFPLHYYNLVSRKRVLTVTFLSWFILTVIAFIVYTFMDVLHACNVVQISPLIYLPICIMYVLMITDSFVISAIIYCIAHNSRRMEAQARSRLFQRLFFVFSSTLWTFVTCLPYRLLYLTNVLCVACRSEFVTQLTDVFFSVLVLGIVINPVITIVTQRLYRQCFIAYAQRFLAFIVQRLVPTICSSSSLCVDFEQSQKGDFSIRKFGDERRRQSYQRRDSNRSIVLIKQNCNKKLSKKTSFANSRNLPICSSSDSKTDLHEITKLTSKPSCESKLFCVEADADNKSKYQNKV